MMLVSRNRSKMAWSKAKGGGTLMLLCSLLLLNTARGQERTSSYQCQIYSCYLSSDMAGWRQVLSQMEQSYSSAKQDWLEMELIRGYYGYIPFAIDQEQKDQAAAMLTKATNHLESYLKRHPRSGEALALKASFCGYAIAISPFKAPVLGPRSLYYLDKALDVEPSNPWVILEKANSLLYIPKMLGGDPAKALELYKKVIPSIEKMGPNTCQWNLLNAYVNKASAEIKQKQYAAALTTYNMALRMAPSFRWIKDKLKPRLLQKMSGSK